MARDEKKIPTDPAHARGQKNKGPDSYKEECASDVLASLGGHTLKARWDHPYPISAKLDDEELRRRKRK
jgi:hypothetical protein